jgi:hypothetical protein
MGQMYKFFVSNELALYITLISLSYWYINALIPAEKGFFNFNLDVTGETVINRQKYKNM